MGGKVVKTELSCWEYRQLREVSEKKKMSLDDAVREAVGDWIRLQTPLEEDPLFKLEPRDTGVVTDTGKLDKNLYD